MNRNLLFVVLLSIVLLSACANGDGFSPDIEPDEIKMLVQDYSTDKITNTSASITSEELIIEQEDGSKTVHNLPEDEFFVSIAPYIETTHPCAIHSLTGCQGELANEEFDVYIEDSEGNRVIDRTMKSESNGFIDLWLPRNQSYRVKISYGEKTVESEISTFENDNTCITTMQLM